MFTIYAACAIVSQARRATYRWDPPRWEHPPCPLPTGTTATTLLGILASHRKIVALASGSLEYYSGLLNAPGPKHLADEDFEFYHEEGDGREYDFVGAWQLDPPSQALPEA